jgi:hypothetical protein
MGPSGGYGTYCHGMESGDACSVFKCSRSVEHTWSTGETDAEEAQWGVCLPHYERMRSGENWGTYTDLPHENEQRIVMGSDFEFRSSEAVQGWRLSLEFGSDGRRIRLALSSSRQHVGVLMDSAQARQLSKVLIELCNDDPDKRRNWDFQQGEVRQDPPQESMQ